MATYGPGIDQSQHVKSVTEQYNKGQYLINHYIFHAVSYCTSLTINNLSFLSSFVSGKNNAVCEIFIYTYVL